MTDQTPHDLDNVVDSALEQRLQKLGREFRYPPTPDLASAVHNRLSQPATRTLRPVLVRAAIIILLLLCVLLAVPQVRAGIRDFIQIGVVRIFFHEPTPTATVPSSGTAAPTATLISSLRDLAGRTTLANARQQFSYPILLPSYPADLGEPDEVFLQQFGGQFVVLVWLDKQHPDKVRLTLQILSPGVDIRKVDLHNVRETTVNGSFAMWAEGPYLVQIRSGAGDRYDVRQLVNGHLLIWFDEAKHLTYRLESDLSMDEAVRIAESLR